ncbi:MAG: diaminopropionate ammonia-lyase [Pyramidobacter sp.]
MKSQFKAVTLEGSSALPPSASFFTQQEAQKVLSFHRSIPGYAPTPLVGLSALARELGIGGLYVKDESFRLGLNSFKVLGGSWCAARCIAEKLHWDDDGLTFQKLTDGDTLKHIDGTTFITATDGNHGRGVAWAAAQLKQRCLVYMPRGSAAERVQNIRKTGAEVIVTPVNYDASVAMARDDAEKNGWLLLQDTSWPGYTTVPTWIMQGYMTLIGEAFRQLDRLPTHLFLQAGVGSMAAAAATFAAHLCGEKRPLTVIVEPNRADCLYRTAEAHDGKLHSVDGPLDSIMAGLSCGVPCSVAWELLEALGGVFVSMPDSSAAQGMRILGSPLPGDSRIISGESGASTVGLLSEALRRPALKWLKEQLRLDENSQVLCISTEGATDRRTYRRVVWDGAWSATEGQ